MKETYFSIIIPVYKVERYLTQCIESVINQSYRNFELILVDDGSPDMCPVICDEYAKRYSQIKVIHKKNGGLSDARNCGIREAIGEYITFIDSDDFWRGKDVLKEINDIVKKNNKPDVIISDIIKYYEHKDKYLYPAIISSDKINGKNKQEVLKYLFFKHADMKMSACQKFIKNDILKPIKFETGLLSEDIDWTFKVYTLAQNICVYSKPYYCYRQQREGSITNTVSRKSFDSLMFIIETWSKKIPLLKIPEEEKQIYLGTLAYQLSILIMLYALINCDKDAKSFKNIKSLKYLFNAPLNFKTKKVKALVAVLGIKGTSRFLYIYNKIRGFLKLG